MTPGLEFRVKNTIEDNGSDLAVSLKFESMQDFEPGAVVEQVPALKALLDARNELRDLLSKADRSEDLERLLEDVLQNKADLSKLAQELAQLKEGKA
jgi:type VI secretion system protein ImpB